MAIMYNIQICVEVEPIAVNNSPIIAYGSNNNKPKIVKLERLTKLDFSNDYLFGENTIWIDFFNKKSNDPSTAIEIKYVIIEGIVVDRFKWAAKYTPKYPEPWASTQTNLESVIESATQLGWNGRWELAFTAPIFTWIHQLEHLGWLYEP